MSRIGIIGAMDVEVDGIIASLTNTTEHHRASIKLVEGELSGVPVVVAQCSVGKVNAAVCAQVMIDIFAPRLIVNIGVAGAIAKGIAIGDLVLASSCVQHDYDTTALDGEEGFGTIWGIDKRYLPCDEKAVAVFEEQAEKLYSGVHRGVIATGDKFIADRAVSMTISKRFGASACEMEGGAIAQVCYLNETPVAVVRSISDNAMDDETMDYVEFVNDAAAKTQELMKAAITLL